MYRSLKILAAGALFAATASVASAAPANMTKIDDGLSSQLTQVQYRGKWDRSCRRGPGGWYRINRRGERRPCREWRGGGKRPDACVKFGPVWFCDY
jgi:hypothetical protein